MRVGKPWRHHLRQRAPALQLSVGSWPTAWHYIYVACSWQQVQQCASRACARLNSPQQPTSASWSVQVEEALVSLPLVSQQAYSVEAAPWQEHARPKLPQQQMSASSCIYV